MRCLYNLKQNFRRIFLIQSHAKSRGDAVVVVELVYLWLFLFEFPYALFLSCLFKITCAIVWCLPWFHRNPVDFSLYGFFRKRCFEAFVLNDFIFNKQYLSIIIGVKYYWLAYVSSFTILILLWTDPGVLAIKAFAANFHWALGVVKRVPCWSCEHCHDIWIALRPGAWNL